MQRRPARAPVDYAALAGDGDDGVAPSSDGARAGGGGGGGGSSDSEAGLMAPVGAAVIRDASLAARAGSAVVSGRKWRERAAPHAAARHPPSHPRSLFLSL